jgi:hypothetical protein
MVQEVYNRVERNILMGNKDQIYKVIKWILRLMLYIMIVIIIFDFTQRTKISSDINMLEYDLMILIHVLLLGVITYWLVHHKEM